MLQKIKKIKTNLKMFEYTYISINKKIEILIKYLKFFNFLI